MNRLKVIIPTLIIMIIIILGICNVVNAVTPNTSNNMDNANIDRIASGSESDGQIVFGANKAEIFKELGESSYDHLTAQEVPRWLFKDYGISMWCIQHGTDVVSHMTATEKHYWAYKGKTEGGATAYDPQNPYYWYRRSAECGMVHKYKDKWQAAKDEAEKIYCDDFKFDEYKDDDGTLNSGNIGTNHNTMPGLNENDPIQSIEWNLVGSLSAETHPDAAFVLTQQKIYETVEDMPFEGTGEWYSDQTYDSLLTQSEINKGYYTLAEKQAALWDTSISTGDPNEGSEKPQPDRKLAFIAKKYMNFYETLRKNEEKAGEGESPFKDVVTPNYVDENNEIQEIDDIHIKQIDNKQLKDPISGEMDDCDTYEYENLKIQTHPDFNNPKNSSYIIGPFVIDYTVDDEYLDSYDIEGSVYEGKSDDTQFEQVKFSAIEKMTVYNKNGDNIVDLGGSFKIAYECKNGEISDEARVKRIEDRYYYEYANGEEISAAMSRKPFYIVVYRGDMKAEDFLGFYAKIDFQYLDSCKAEMYEYEGTVIEYYYTEKEGTYTFSYSHSRKSKKRM